MAIVTFNQIKALVAKIQSSVAYNTEAIAGAIEEALTSSILTIEEENGTYTFKQGGSNIGSVTDIKLASADYDADNSLLTLTLSDGTQITVGLKGDYITVTEPTLSSNLTYTGSAQSPTWSNYDSAQLTIGGRTSATDAGTYYATFTPNEGYAWSDGTQSTRSVGWSIAKAAGSMTLSSYNVELGAAGSSETVTVTRSGDGTISATSDNSNVASVSVRDTSITITSVGSGDTTITVNCAEGTNYTAPAA